jgi:hypothetical protein
LGAQYAIAPSNSTEPKIGKLFLSDTNCCNYRLWTDWRVSQEGWTDVTKTLHFNIHMSYLIITVFILKNILYTVFASV